MTRGSAQLPKPEPLRILHVLSTPGAGGAEMYVKDLAIELVRRGHRPHILFVSRAADVGASESFERTFLAELDAHGIGYGFIGHDARKKPWIGAWRVRRYCRSKRIGIYHSHLKYALVFGAGLRIPRVHTHHNFEPHAPLWMYPIFNRLVDCWVGISAVCSRQLESYTGRPVTTIHNAVDPARVIPGGAVARAVSDTMQCIAVGRLIELKNHGPLIDALAALPEAARARLKIGIAGDGDAAIRAALQRRIAETGLSRHIALLGNREDVPELLRNAQLFLMTSASEGFPIALLEATVAGLPFIATDVGGCPEVADIGGNGIIIPVNDPNALAAELEALLASPQRLHQLSLHALANGGAFAIGPCAEKHLRLYAQVLAG